MPDIVKSFDDVRQRRRDMRDGTYAENFAPVSQSMFRTTFAKSIAAGADPDFFRQIGPLGSGITYSQTGGNLVLNSGTAANAELILRSNDFFIGPHEVRWQSVLSQRIVNNLFVIELVDVIGDNIPFVINSAVSITLNIPRNPFTAENIGQSVSLGAFNTTATAVCGRYAIAAVSGSAVTFTVSGFSASGSGTCSAFGWNFHRCAYGAAVATNASYDTGRRGYASGDTTATINTTASPGHMGVMVYEDGMAAFLDQLVASSIGIATTQRASRVMNLPDESANLYLQIRVTNGSTAPTSTTAWTVGMVSVTEYQPVTVAITTVRPQPANSVAPVTIQGGTLPAVTTVSTVSTVTAVTGAGTPAVPASPFFVNSAASTNGALVLTGTSGLCALWASNIGATAAFVKLYNKATAPTVGTDVPEMIIPVAAAVGGFPGIAEISPGFNAYRFPLGLGIAITGAVADSDTTAVAAGQVKVKLSRTV
jgi:hypothetical protein